MCFLYRCILVSYCTFPEESSFFSAWFLIHMKHNNTREDKHKQNNTREAIPSGCCHSVTDHIMTESSHPLYQLK